MIPTIWHSGKGNSMEIRGCEGFGGKKGAMGGTRDFLRHQKYSIGYYNDVYCHCTFVQTLECTTPVVNPTLIMDLE